jgi:hypothetical protein
MKSRYLQSLDIGEARGINGDCSYQEYSVEVPHEFRC